MAIERVPLPPDPRSAGVRAMKRFVELPDGDAEAATDRRLLRRMDLAEAVRG